MKAHDIIVLTAFFLLCTVLVAAAVVAPEIPTQDARAAPTISIPDAPQ
jgi:hypothetical protein